MQAIFNRKESAIRSQPFTIDKIVELNEAQYKYFCDSPLDTYGFIDSFKDKSHFDENGVAKCILVLEEGKDDGILLVAEGYEYARYTSYLPCARQIAMLGQYPSLGKYAQKMATLADRYTAVALENQVNGETQFKESSVLENIDIDEEVGEPFNKHLFIEMMNERPEIQNLSWHYGGYTATIAEDYLHTEPLRELTQEDVDIMCAKHTLWLHDASGGEQADFSRCLLKDIKLTSRNLSSATFDGAVLSDVQMSDCELCFTSFKGAQFDNCNMSNCFVEESTFRNAVIHESNISQSIFTHCNFAWSKVLDTNAIGAKFTRSCMEGMDQTGSQGIDLRDESLNYIEDNWIGDDQDNNIRMEETQ